MKKIGFISAVNKESESFIKLLKEPIKTDIYGEIIIKTFIFNDKEIYHAQSSVGEIFASIAATLLISCYNVEAIINFGLAGGAVNNKIGGLYLVNKVVHYDFDLSAIDSVPVGKYDCFDSVYIPTDESLRACVKSFAPDLPEVICASADKFVSDSKIKNWLKQTFNADIFEMEAAAIAICGYNAKIPVLIVKEISDVDDSKNEYYDYKNKLKFNFVFLLEKLLSVL